MTEAFEIQRSRSVGRAHPREGRGVRAELLPARVRDLRPQPDARVHGVLGHAVALPALVVRQGLREAEDALRLRRLRPALRDGDQLEPRSGVPDARQLAAAADPDHRARLRPQRLLQEQLHLQDDAARVHHQHVQGARQPRARATSKTRASDSRRSRTSSTRRTPCRCNAAATSPSASAHRRRSGSDLARRRPAARRSVPARASPPGVRRARPAQGAAGARRRPAAVHPRSQPVPGRVGEGSPHHRARGGAVLHPADRNQDHERGLGHVLAQAHPRQPRAAAGPCSSSSSCATTRSCGRFAVG